MCERLMRLTIVGAIIALPVYLCILSSCLFLPLSLSPSLPQLLARHTLKFWQGLNVHISKGVAIYCSVL